MNEREKPTVAVVGSGLAGLLAAYRLADVADVHIYEASNQAGLDGSVVRYGQKTIDVPMRAFASGFYSNLTRLCEELHVPLKQKYYSFTLTSQDGTVLKYYGAGGLRGFWTSSFRTMLVMTVSYIYVSVLAVLFGYILPTFGISLGRFLSIFMVPQRFILFLCSLFGVMCGLTDGEVLRMPADDFLRYKAQTTLRPHYSFRWGVESLKKKLLHDSIHLHVNSPILLIRKTAHMKYKIQTNHGYVDQVFDHVIVTTAPNATRQLLQDTDYSPLLSNIPHKSRPRRHPCRQFFASSATQRYQYLLSWRNLNEHTQSRLSDIPNHKSHANACHRKRQGSIKVDVCKNASHASEPGMHESITGNKWFA